MKKKILRISCCALIFAILILSLLVSCQAPLTYEYDPPKYETYDDYLKTISPYYEASVFDSTLFKYRLFSAWPSFGFDESGKLTDVKNEDYRVDLEITFKGIPEDAFGRIIFVDPATNKEYPAGNFENNAEKFDSDYAGTLPDGFYTFDVTPVTLAPTKEYSEISSGQTSCFEFDYGYVKKLNEDDDSNNYVSVSVLANVGQSTAVIVRMLDKNGKTVDEQYLNVDAVIDYWLRCGIIQLDDLPEDWSYDKNWSYGGYSPS